MNMHILWRKADEVRKYWCPYCDEVTDFGTQTWYAEVWCLKCKRVFGYEWNQCYWPQGFDIKTGELLPEG